MKKTMLILVLLVALATGLSAMQTLFVIDEYTGFSNFLTIQASLDRIGLDYDVYSIPDTAIIPSADLLNQYDLVIWYCSYSGMALGFWNISDFDNPELISYLNGGGNLWVMGTDILYDRYGAPPDEFEAGSFVYDFLGIASYSCQSKSDDGDLGVSQLDPVANEQITDMPMINWFFPTSWYVDGLIPTPSAVPIYQMGPESYILHEYSSAILNVHGSAAVLGFYFDPYEFVSDALRDTVFVHGKNYFEGLIPTANSDVVISPMASDLCNYPNPFNPETNISFSLSTAMEISLDIYNMKGERVRTLEHSRLLPGKHSVVWNGRDDQNRRVSSGLYFSKLRTSQGTYLHKMMLME